MARQALVEIRVQFAVVIRERHLLGVVQHRQLGVVEQLGCRGLHGRDLRIAEARRLRARHVLLVAGSTAVDLRQPEARELLVALGDAAAEKDVAVELTHHEIQQLGRCRKDLHEGRLAGELVQRVPDLP